MERGNFRLETESSDPQLVKDPRFKGLEKALSSSYIGDGGPSVKQLIQSSPCLQEPTGTSGNVLRRAVMPFQIRQHLIKSGLLLFHVY